MGKAISAANKRTPDKAPHPGRPRRRATRNTAAASATPSKSGVASLIIPSMAGWLKPWGMLDAFLRENPFSERRFRVQDEARWLDLFLRYDSERAVRFARLLGLDEMPFLEAALRDHLATDGITMDVEVRHGEAR